VCVCKYIFIQDAETYTTISSETQKGVENVIATRQFGCTGSAKAFYSVLDIAGGDIPIDKHFKVKCTLIVKSAKENYLVITSRHTITGKIEWN